MELAQQLAHVVFNLFAYFQSLVEVGVLPAAVWALGLVQHHEERTLVALKDVNFVWLELLLGLVQVIENLCLGPLVINFLGGLGVGDHGPCSLCLDLFLLLLIVLQ